MDLQTMKDIRDDEGESLTVYEDTLGHLTVGIGHRVLPADKLKLGDVITKERSKTLFLDDLKLAMYGARVLMDKMSVPPVVSRVVTNMVFQMGLEGVRSFRLFWGFLRARDYSNAAKEMLDSKWAKHDSPARAKRLATEIRLLDPCQHASVKQNITKGVCVK